MDGLQPSNDKPIKVALVVMEIGDLRIDSDLVLNNLIETTMILFEHHDAVLEQA